MGKYHRFEPRLWQKMKVEKWSDDARPLGVYLMTCEHATNEGLYRLPKLYIQSDLDWSERRVKQTVSELLRNGFCNYDETVDLVLIPFCLEVRSPQNLNQAKGALKALEDLPETRLLNEWISLAERHSKQLRKLLPQWLPKRFPNGFETSPLSNSNSNSNSSSNSKEKKKEKESVELATPTSTVVSELFAYWQLVCGHPNAQLSTTRQAKIKARLADSTTDEIKQAIDGAAKAAYVNDDGVKYDDIELICRSREKLELFIKRANSTGKITTADRHIKTVRDELDVWAEEPDMRLVDSTAEELAA